MKLLYITPASLTVQLGTMQMMAESPTININRSGSAIERSSDILVKEDNTSDTNLWDDEW